MTAKLVYHTDRTEFDPWEAEMLSSSPQLAESGLYSRFHGQLWEREAERTTFDPTVLMAEQWRRISIIRNELGTRRH